METKAKKYCAEEEKEMIKGLSQLGEGLCWILFANPLVMAFWQKVEKTIEERGKFIIVFALGMILINVFLAIAESANPEPSQAVQVTAAVVNFLSKVAAILLVWGFSFKAYHDCAEDLHNENADSENIV